MAKFITATENKNSVIIRTYNKKTKALSTKTAYFYGTYNESVKRDLRKYYESNDQMIVKFYDDTVATVESAKYCMPESEFYNNAKVMDKRPAGDYISRTATASKCQVLLYNSYTDDTEIMEKYASGKNFEKVCKTIEREFKNTDYIVLEIEIIDTVNALYVMPSGEFFKKATPIEK